MNEIPGYSGFLWLYDEFVQNAHDGAIVVEVGVALGHSIAHLARRVLESGKKIEIWAVDPWGGYARNGEQQQALGEATTGDFALFLRTMLERAPAETEIVNVIRATSERSFRLFERLSVDLVLIDAAHDYHSVMADISFWSTRVKIGGIIAGDDHEPHYPGVEEACVASFGREHYEVRGSTWVKRL